MESEHAIRSYSNIHQEDVEWLPFVCRNGGFCVTNKMIIVLENFLKKKEKFQEMIVSTRTIREKIAITQVVTNVNDQQLS